MGPSQQLRKLGTPCASLLSPRGPPCQLSKLFNVSQVEKHGQSRQLDRMYFNQPLHPARSRGGEMARARPGSGGGRGAGGERRPPARTRFLHRHPETTAEKEDKQCAHTHSLSYSQWSVTSDEIKVLQDGVIVSGERLRDRRLDRIWLPLMQESPGLRVSSWLARCGSEDQVKFVLEIGARKKPGAVQIL